jgi:hypothetical protein
MIKRIFQDLDECILHTTVNNDPGQTHVEFMLPEDVHTYRTIIRPCAKELFAYYNDLIGKENVYILTTATREYAEALNRLGEFGLDYAHIFTREDIQQYKISFGYGGEGVMKMPIADKDNVLIDNLPPRYNCDKMDMMSIVTKNYHQTPEYYGNNLNDEDFFENIKKFLKERA